MSPETRRDLEAAAFRSLVAHLQWRTDVQNIALMNLAGFCRNCLAKWLVAAAKERAVALDSDEARAWVYGMPYDEWKTKHQEPATPEQQAAFKETAPLHAKHDV